MKSTPVRKKDHLLSPENAALLIIDYQPPQIFTTVSMDRQLMIDNMKALIRSARTFKLPIILSTVNNSNGINPDTIPQLKKLLGGVPSIDRTSINAWEDEEFLAAVKATGRKKLIVAALWTDACLLFPTLDAIKEGYEVYPAVDCVGANSVLGHKAALERMVQAGAHPTVWNSVACELQRDWARTETVGDFVELVKDQGAGWGWYLTLENEINEFHHYRAGDETPAHQGKQKAVSMEMRSH